MNCAVSMDDEGGKVGTKVFEVYADCFVVITTVRYATHVC